MHKVVITLPKVDAIVNKQTLKFASEKIARVYFRTNANFHFETKHPVLLELYNGNTIIDKFDKLTSE